MGLLVLDDDIIFSRSYSRRKKVGWIVTSLLVHIKLSTWKSSELGMVTLLNQCTSK